MYSILIVEDDEFQRASLKKMLQSLNKRFNIYEASNALDAFNLAKDIEINLFLVDIELEESSGLHLANKLRSEEHTSELQSRQYLVCRLLLDKKLRSYVQRINSEGTTILLTTHYLAEAEQLCDLLAFITE